MKFRRYFLNSRYEYANYSELMMSYPRSLVHIWYTNVENFHFVAETFKSTFPYQTLSVQSFCIYSVWILLRQVLLSHI